MMHLVRICSTRMFLDSWLRVTLPSGGTESPSAGGASVWTVQTIAARGCQHRRPRHQHKEDWEPSAVQPQLQFSLLLHGGNRYELLDINSTYESQNLNYIWRSIWTWSLLTRFSTEISRNALFGCFFLDISTLCLFIHIKLNNIIINIHLIYLFLYIFTTSSSIDQLNQLAEFYFLKKHLFVFLPIKMKHNCVSFEKAEIKSNFQTIRLWKKYFLLF